MSEDDLNEEKALLKELEKKEVNAFMRFYQLYSPDLLIQAYSILDDASLAQAIVDELFEKLLKQNPFSALYPPIQVFLFEEMRRLCKTKYPLLYRIAYPAEK